MSEPPPLRLGVWCAALRDGSVLLSKRSDLNVWALPGGRLDHGESLVTAAAREVEEETGVLVTGLRPAGLYYMAGWRRLNVLFVAAASPGDTLGRTLETRDNRFFPLNALPAMPLAAPAHDAANGGSGQMRVIQTTRWRRWRLRARFGLRYIENAVRGRPEPSFPRLSVSAVALISNSDNSRILTLPGDHSAAGQLRALPRLPLFGEPAPWAALSAQLSATVGLRAALRWAGIRHDPGSNTVEFVFAGTADATARGEWAPARTAALHGRDADYLRCAGQPEPWFIEAGN